MNDEIFLDYAIELANILESISLRDYYYSKLPNHIDEQIISICDSIIAAEPSQRSKFNSLLDEDIKALLAMFGRRMTMVGVRKNSSDYLLKGLIFLAFAVDKSDYHGILMTISLFYHSASKLKMNSEVLFVSASQYAPNEFTRKLLLDSLNRSPENQGIDKMGFKEVDGQVV